jgi:UDP-N-acetylmuramate dehydrogenase
MMARTRDDARLLPRLPKVRGRYTENALLSKYTWFRVGGPAEVMYRPADADDLRKFLAEKPSGVPVTVIGVAANLLVRDGGVPGVVIRLADGFADIEIAGLDIHAGAGVSNLKLANAARDAAIAGLEFLSGIPGSIGGALAMNAGAFGGEMKDITVGATALGRTGAMHELDKARLNFGYRRSGVPSDWIFVSAHLRGRAGDPAEIRQRMVEIQRERAVSQPTRTPTGGSTFVNPPGKKAWELIDAAGCRGLRRGGAQVSEKHCNFLINTGNATAADIEALGEKVRRRVREATGVTLEWEIRRIGVNDGPAAREVTR